MTGSRGLVKLCRSSVCKYNLTGDNDDNILFRLKIKNIENGASLIRIIFTLLFLQIQNSNVWVLIFFLTNREHPKNESSPTP